MLTRQLVQRLGGTISFVSKEGMGTLFTLKLPAASTSVPSDRVEMDLGETETVRGDEVTKDTILFVDDNADLRQYIKMAFGDTYRVVDAESGDAALRYLQENGECDIVVSDVMMPGMQGDELCRRIKENKETSWLPVILLTAKAGRDFMIEGLGLGADDYIAKPFDSAILASKIDSMLKNRRRLSQYYMERSLALVREEAQENAGEASQSSLKSVPSNENKLSDDEKPSDEKKLSDEKKPSVDLNPQDQAFVEKATRLVLDHIADSDFGIDELCREMAMSRSLFYGHNQLLILYQDVGKASGCYTTDKNRQQGSHAQVYHQHLKRKYESGNRRLKDSSNGCRGTTAHQQNHGFLVHTAAHFGFQQGHLQPALLALPTEPPKPMVMPDATTDDQQLWALSLEFFVEMA